MHVVHIGACSLVSWTASSGFSVRACLTAVQQQPVNLDHVKSAGPSCLGGARMSQSLYLQQLSSSSLLTLTM